jgi:DNA-binding NarL/FixJ family response regulator
MCKQPIEILIVDDQPVVIEGMRAVLSEYADVRIIGVTTCALEIFNRIKALTPDIVIMEAFLPFLNVILSVLQIKRIDPIVKIILFTQYSSPELLIPLMRVGVSCCVLKQDPLLELYWAVQVAKRGGQYFSEKVNRFLADYSRRLVH